MKRCENQHDEEQVLQQLLDANARLEQEVKELLMLLEAEERETLPRMLSLQQRVAWKRMQQAVGQLDAATSSRSSGSGAKSNGNALAQDFDWHNKSRYQRERESKEICNSLLRPRRSFFSEQVVHNTRKRKPSSFDGNEPTKRFEEPEPNAETQFLRGFCNPSFHLVPFVKFSPQERVVLKQFVLALQQDGVQVDTMKLSMWNRLSVGSTKLNRSGFECFLWWQLHENPTVRRAAWTKQEDEALRRLAEGHEADVTVNDWQEIAKRLPFPGRLPVHCLIRYQTVLNKRALQGEFTPQEDTFLTEAVEIFGEKFNIIADLMDGRVAEQLYSRWNLTLSPEIRQGFWSAVEERRLLLALYCYHGQHPDHFPEARQHEHESVETEAVSEVQHDNEPFDSAKVCFTDLSFHIPGRHGGSIRDHFVNSMNLKVSFTKFSKQEDQKLLELLQKFGGPLVPRIWSRIAKELGTRSDHQVRNRWAMLAPLEYQQFVQDRENQSKTPALFSRVSKRKRKQTSTTSIESSADNVDDENLDASLSSTVTSAIPAPSQMRSLRSRRK